MIRQAILSKKLRRGDLAKRPEFKQSLELLRKFIAVENFSIEDASMMFDVDIERAKYLLMSKKPSQEDINKAMHLYKEGFSVTRACVAAGVSDELFMRLLREQSGRNISKKFRIKRRYIRSDI